MATRIFPAWRRPQQRWRFLALLLSVAVGAGLTACAATDARTEASADHPAAVATGVASPPPGVVVTADVPYAGTTNRLQRLDICAPAADGGAARPAVLLLHGGGWMHGDKAVADYHRVCTWLAQSGFVTFDADYRLAPAVRFPAPLEDATAALRFIRMPATAERYELDTARVGVVGGSAGGNLAALLALRGHGGTLTTGDRVAALVDLSGPVDLTAAGRSRSQSPELTRDELSYLGCRRLASCPTAKRASPLFDVDPSDPPTFIGQASVDFVPHQQGDRLRAALEDAGVPVTLEQRPGRAHSIGVLTPAMKADVVTFLHDRLG
ncbi:MAG TPA: alpha/beta hydrolase [Gryllotalpicola sp.]